MRTGFLAAAFAVAVVGGEAAAQGQVTLYCSAQEEWCRGLVQGFERKTGIKVAMTRKSSGETFAQIKAEAANPRGDVWWGGTGDPHLQAAEEGLTIEHKSPKLAELHDWAVRQAEQSKHRTVGVYTGALGFGYNSEILAKRKIAAPKCWADLLKPDFKDEVQVADPNASGTAYTLMATIIQVMGEEQGFDYLKKLHRNVNQYTKSGAAPAKAAGLGETMVGIVFMHDLVTMKVQGMPIEVVAPCEGTGYEIGSMSLVKGAKNLENAKVLYDWLLTPEAQAIGAEQKSFQIPSNKASPIPKESPKLADIKLISYDFAKYGASAERTRLLARWDKEVKSAPK
jgi:iron(III) transport system substrate-binding protein